MGESSSSHPSLEIGQEKDANEINNDGNEMKDDGDGTVNDDIEMKSDGNEIKNDGNEMKDDGDETVNDGNGPVNDEIEMEEKVNVEDKVEEPKVGMMFNAIDEVLQYYKEYANRLGFPIKKRSTKKDDDGVLRYVILACSLSGTSGRNPNKGLKSTISIKTNCKALLSVKLCSDGRWQVRSVRLDHNHDLGPDVARYFGWNWALKSQEKRKLDESDTSGSNKTRNISPTVVEAVRPEKAPNLENDGRNHSEEVSRLQLEEGDATSILNYLMKMQVQNASFFYSIDLDKEGRLRNVFWADARSRAAYEEFGDVITFETSYLTKKYAMPFAPFLGVNHHGQPILFGCGLVSSEDTETFIWLFQSWLTCMSGRAPRGIVTVQDKAMGKAIEIVFPNARHRWCFWHIMKKLPEMIKDDSQKEAIISALQSTVYDSLSQTEFEEQWNEMIKKYKLQSNGWLIELYNERRRWVPVFVKEIFWAGISPIQRSLTMHAFFDDHVKSKTTLKQFVEKYENALKSNVEKENHEDFKCFSSHVDSVTRYEMEKQAQDVYTISKFKEFQTELAGKMYCDLASLKADGSSTEYEISEDVMIGERKQSVNFKVWFRESDNEIKCSCCMFEFMGIICRHAIYVFIRHKIHLLPDKYILPRWRKDVKRCHTNVKLRYSDWDATPEALRCDEMQKTFDKIKELANDSEDKCKFVGDWMHKLMEELSNFEGNLGNNQPTTDLPTSRSFGNDVTGISKESQSILNLNDSYGGQGMGNVSHPIFFENHIQGHHQVWNGDYGMYNLPSSSTQGVGNLGFSNHGQ